MGAFGRLLVRLQSEDRGASLVEYAMIVTFIMLVAVAAVTVVGKVTAGHIESSHQIWTG